MRGVKYLILYGVLSVVAYLAWLGWTFLKGLGAAFGNANSSTGPGDIAWVLIVVGIATGACVIGAFFMPANVGRIVALAPIGLILAGEGFIAYQTKVRGERYARRRQVEQAAREKILEPFSRDYRIDMKDFGEYTGTRESFLTHDREFNVILQIDVGYETAPIASGIGIIKGDVLETRKQGPNFEKWCRKYVDAEGKTIFDRYTIRHVPNQSDEAYRLERFDP